MEVNRENTSDVKYIAGEVLRRTRPDDFCASLYRLAGQCEAIRANVIQGMDLVYSQTKSGVDSCDLHSEPRQLSCVHLIMDFTIDEKGDKNDTPTNPHISLFAHIIGGTDPAWSPDGTGIACSIDERLTFVNLRTRARKQLLPQKAIQWQRLPSWSATGNKLAFSGNNHPVALDRQQRNEWMDKNTIFIVNSDGTRLQQLVAEAGPYAWSPELSPNGQEVLYTQAIQGVHQILKIDVHSGIRTQLTDNIWSFGGDWFDPTHALPVSPQPHLLTTTWGKVKK